MELLQMKISDLLLDPHLDFLSFPKHNTAVLCPWARHFTPRKYWLITQEAMAPSRYDWKIVDWDVKPQHNQPKP